jgi:hypothetical protein
MKVKLGGDFSKVPDSNPLPEGLFVFKLTGVDERPSKKTEEPMVELKWLAVRDADGNKLKDAKGKATTYDPVFTYAPLDPESSWARRMKELLHALGTKQTGTVDIKEGAEVLGRVKHQPNQDGDGTRPNVTKIMKLTDQEGAGDEEEEDDEDEGVDLSTLDRAALKKLIKENELEIKVVKSMDDDAIREAIAELLGEDEEEPDEEDEEEEEEDDEEEDEDDEEEVDLSGLDRNALKAFIKENELEVKVVRSDTADTLRNKIAEVLGEEEEDDDEEDDEVEDNYDELDVATLRQELKDRELDSAGKKVVLIARLRADDAAEPV